MKSSCSVVAVTATMLKPLLTVLTTMKPLLTTWLLLCTHLPSVAAWQASTPLGRVGQLSWTSDVNKGVIMFEICLQTDGWLGLGLSQTGTMAGADLVIGWFDERGVAHSKDCWAPENGAPSVDQKQNWQLHTARRNGTHTMLRFRRRLYTGDSKDLYISGQPIHVLYAWRDRSQSDSPAPLTIDRLQYHGRENRGAVTLCLLHDDCFPPLTAGSNPAGRWSLVKVVMVGLVLLGCG